MELEKKFKVLHAMYAGVLADSVLRFSREGILEKVTEEKRAEQLKSGGARAQQMGLSRPQDVVSVLSEIFGCANWEVKDTSKGFSAEATGCMLCSMSKRLGTESPCKIYCLNPMEAMIKGVCADAEFIVNQTLWEGQKCHIEVLLEQSEQ